MSYESETVRAFWRHQDFVASLSEDCEHDEHDRGICLHCGKDISEDLQAAAENAADSREDR